MSELYRQASREDRAAQAIDLLEWGIMLMKASLLFALGAIFMMLINRIAYGLLCIAINWGLMLVSHILRGRAHRIYPEGEM